jgi:hypothetical protein
MTNAADGPPDLTRVLFGLFGVNDGDRTRDNRSHKREFK